MWKFNTLKCSTNTIVARSCQRFSRSNGALTSLSWSWSSSSTMTTSTGTGSRRTISTVTNRLRIGVVGFDGNNNNNNNNRTNPRVAQFHVLAASRAEHSHQKQPFRPQKQKQPQQIIRWFDNEAEYHIVADETLEGLQDSIEQALEGLENTPEEMDISLASGVLTIQLPPHGTWVLNKQTPNQQIWWSSPLSGPKRFEYTEDGNLWFATQNGLSLVPLLAEELSHVLKTNIELKINE